MPTYARLCGTCSAQTTLWQSIHDDTPMMCGKCGGSTVAVIEQVNAYAVGSRGRHTAISDMTDREWSRDMDAYSRFKKDGLQPPKITGCDELESTAVGRWHVETGQPHRDEVIADKTETARAIMRGQI